LKNQNQREQSCTLSGKREKKKEKKNDHRQQSDYYTPSCVTPLARGHGGTSKKTIEG